MTKKAKIVLAAAGALVAVNIVGRRLYDSPKGGSDVATPTGRGTTQIGERSRSRSPAERERLITRAELGDAWPLTVDSGTIRCDRSAVTFTAAKSGQTYALNGVAMSRGFPEIEPIWQWREETLGSTLPVRKNIQLLPEAAFALCG